MTESPYKKIKPNKDIQAFTYGLASQYETLSKDNQKQHKDNHINKSMPHVSHIEILRLLQYHTSSQTIKVHAQK